MLQILRFFKGHVPSLIACLALLVVQALFELALPGFMSDIVDVGIQRGGIESCVPVTVRADTLSELTAMMAPSERALVESSYAPPDAAGIRTLLPDADAGAGGALARALEAPEAAMGGELEEAAGAREVSAYASEADVEGLRAVAFVREEYRAQGTDLVALQNAYLAKMAWLMFGVTAGSFASTLCVGYIASRTGAAIARDTRRELFSKVMDFSPAEVGRFSQASLITRSTNDVQQIQFVITMSLRMVLFAPIMGIVAIVEVTMAATGLEWVIPVAVVAVLALMGIMFGLTMPRFRLMQRLVDRVNFVARDLLDGLMPIRAFNREGFELERFDGASAELRDAQLFTGRVMGLVSPAIMLVMNLVTVAIVWFGADVIARGDLLVGTMMAFISYAMLIVSAFMVLAMVAVMLPRAQVAAQRIHEVLETEPSIASPEDAEKPGEDVRGAVGFHDVTFAYPGAQEPVLSHVDFTCERGETVAIIGATGAGKSTLVSLVPRLWDVTAGSVTVDGVDVRRLSLSDLRGRIGYVPQQGLLFKGTIASNIAFGKDGASAATIERSADIAQAKGFIEEREGGFDAPISERGANVSGGQRQRLAIARALAVKPEILILDDAFSALDYRTDAALRKALAEEVSDTTVLVVAQRVATIMGADEIVVLDEGGVAGKGTHAELLRCCPAYLRIAASQLAPEELGMSEAELEAVLAGTAFGREGRTRGSASSARPIEPPASTGGSSRSAGMASRG